MHVGKKILAGLVLAVGTAVLLLSLTASVAVWVVKGPATAKASHVFDRVEAALDLADEHLAEVKASLARAAERLDKAREEQRKLAQEPRPTGTLQRIVARQVLPTVAPDLGNAQEKLHTAAEAVVVANSVLADLGNFPLLSVAGVDVEAIQQMNGRLVEVAPAAWNLSRLFAEADSDAAEQQCSRIGRALATVQGLLAEYGPELTTLRQRVEGVKASTLPWATPAAVLLTLFLVWVAASQVSVLAHAWAWWTAPK